MSMKMLEDVPLGRVRNYSWQLLHSSIRRKECRLKTSLGGMPEFRRKEEQE